MTETVLALATVASGLVGGLVAVALAAVLAWDTAGRTWVLAGAVLSVATVGVTGAANVPLNEAMAVGDATPARLRSDYEARWNAWNPVRTATSVAAAGCLVVACLRV